MKRKILAILIAVLVCLDPLSSFAAYQSSTLRHGMSGDDVKEVQQALIILGYLKGSADGIFGNRTENAVRSFQRKNKLNVDGLVGSKTKELLLSKVSVTSSSSGGNSGSSSSGSNSSTSQNSQNSASGSSLFSGDYTTLKSGSRGSRVRTLQNALIKLKYLGGSADGNYGKKTKAAVVAFQQRYKLKTDGAAGKKTLTALENAYRNGETASSAPASDSASSSSPSPEQTETVSDSVNPKITPPAIASIKLLSWYDQVKPLISAGQKLLIYDPSSGLSWTLRILSRGRHCDAEPLTAQDTRTMVKAFGGQHTWNQKGVYVKLPDGRWSIGSTHDMPHDSGTISNNGFNGHLCVHFLRTMEETRQNDPKYGVANQETIRKLWERLTGQVITD